MTISSPPAGLRDGAVRVLILGTGSMARRHAEFLSQNPDCAVVAGVDTDAERLAQFLTDRAIPRGFADLEEALAWDGFDAVCNVTPDRIHHATTMRLAQAGKHVLCEKPLAENHAEALEMTQAMESRGLVNLVNLRYRAVPEIAMAAQLVAEGAIGEVRHL